MGRSVPASLPRQVDSTTCGIAALAAVAARAGRLGNTEPAGPGAYAHAHDEVNRRVQLELHRIAARTGLPWPQALGTSPWALAKLARGATGERYRILPWIGVWRRAASRAVDRAVEAGLDVFVYTGTKRIPRHVVAILGQRSTAVFPPAGGEPESRAGKATGTYVVFEPSSGSVLRVDRAAFASGADSARAALGNWTHVLMTVVPDVSRPRNRCVAVRPSSIE